MGRRKLHSVRDDGTYRSNSSIDNPPRYQDDEDEGQGELFPEDLFQMIDREGEKKFKVEGMLKLKSPLRGNEPISLLKGEVRAGLVVPLLLAAIASPDNQRKMLATLSLTEDAEAEVLQLLQGVTEDIRTRLREHQSILTANPEHRSEAPTGLEARAGGDRF